MQFAHRNSRSLGQLDTPGFVPISFHVNAKLGRFAFGNAQRSKLSSTKMLGQKYDLPGVIAIVLDLTVDGLKHGVFLASNPDTARQIILFERIYGVKNALPAGVPPEQDLLRHRGTIEHEFLVAVAV